MRKNYLYPGGVNVMFSPFRHVKILLTFLLIVGAVLVSCRRELDIECSDSVELGPDHPITFSFSVASPEENENPSRQSDEFGTGESSPYLDSLQVAVASGDTTALYKLNQASKRSSSSWTKATNRPLVYLPETVVDGNGRMMIGMNYSPMKSVSDRDSISTKVNKTTLLGGAHIVCVTGSSGNESLVWSDYYYLGSESSISSGRYWPSADAGYKFYACNVLAEPTFSSSGTTVYAYSDNDVVVAYNTSSTYGASVPLSFSHIFGEMGDVFISTTSGVDATNIDIRLTPKISGTYNIRTGAWSNVSYGTPKNIANRGMDGSGNAWLLIPGTYTISASWNIGSNSYADSANITIEAGKTLNLYIELGGEDISWVLPSSYTKLTEAYIAHPGNSTWWTTLNGYRFYGKFGGTFNFGTKVLTQKITYYLTDDYGPILIFTTADPAHERPSANLKYGRYWQISVIHVMNHAYYDVPDRRFQFTNKSDVSKTFRCFSSGDSEPQGRAASQTLTANFSTSKWSYTDSAGGYFSGSGSLTESSFFSDMRNQNFYVFVRCDVLIDGTYTRSSYKSPRFRRATLKQDNVDVVDIIPVRRNSDGVVGLYDGINGTFVYQLTNDVTSDVLTFTGVN